MLELAWTRPGPGAATVPGAATGRRDAPPNARGAKCASIEDKDLIAYVVRAATGASSTDDRCRGSTCAEERLNFARGAREEEQE